MTKAELQAEVDRLKKQVSSLHTTNDALLQGGLIYQRQFESAYDLLQKLPGASPHPLWLEIQDFLNKYEVVQHPIYGRKVFPK